MSRAPKTRATVRAPAPAAVRQAPRDRGRTLAVSLVAPAYLFACLVLGGSAQGVWGNMILQLAGIFLIGWAALRDPEKAPAPMAARLLLLAGLAVVVVLIQLTPLPPGVWSGLGPRGAFAANFAILGMKAPLEPLSVDPADTLDALLKFIPPIALFCAMVRLRAYRVQWLAIALVGGAVLGIALGALQVATSNGSDLSPWYLYEDTNGGKAVGFFANANHMAALLVMTIPFLAATVALAKTVGMQAFSAIMTVCVGLFMVIIVGLALNGSFAGYGLVLPVAAGAMLLLIPKNSWMRTGIIGLVSVLTIAAVIALHATDIGSGRLSHEAGGSVTSRHEIFSTTSEAAKAFMPFGSGLGTFRDVYQLYEQPEKITSTYVVHAHNDYIETVLELGLAGVILIGLFLAWWVMAVWQAWQSADAGVFARAAAIASAAVLAHSLVDFPLRTAAVSATFAMCLALLADRRSAPLHEPSSLRTARHVKFG